MEKEILDARVHDALSQLAHAAYDLAQRSPEDPDTKHRLAELADEYTLRVLRLCDESFHGRGKS